MSRVLLDIEEEDLQLHSDVGELEEEQSEVLSDSSSDFTDDELARTYTSFYNAPLGAPKVATAVIAVAAAEAPVATPATEADQEHCTTTIVPVEGLSAKAKSRGRKKGQVAKYKKVKDKNYSKIRRIRKRMPADYSQTRVDYQLERLFANSNDPLAISFGRMIKTILDYEIPLAIEKAQVLKNVKPNKISRRCVANPFIIFQQANIERIKLANKECTQMKEFSRQLSEQWRHMTQEEKQPYYDQYRARRSLHEEKLNKMLLEEQQAKELGLIVEDPDAGDTMVSDHDDIAATTHGVILDTDFDGADVSSPAASSLHGLAASSAALEIERLIA